MSEKSKKIYFIVFVSLFAALWAFSMVSLGIAAFSETTTASIEAWYSETFTDADAVALGEAKEAELDLMNFSTWMTVISTAGLLITLLFKELKKKYVVKK